VFNIVRSMGLNPEVLRASMVDGRTRALSDYARTLTLTTTAVGADEAVALRAHGFGDAAIHDAMQMVGCLNYINRIAEGVGTDAEPEWAPR
jgi:alkylhydroperoxidase family enzyme